MLRALGLALGVPAGRAPGGLGGGLETGSAGSTALVSRTSGWRLDARVFEEPGQYKGCPAGQRNARENECLAAVTAATHAEGLALAYPYAVKYVDRGPDDLVPGGCSYSKRHGQRAMWNRNPSGRSTASYPLVCIDDVLSTSPAPTPSPEPAPVASEGGWTLDPRVHEEPGQFTGCPDGQRNAAESECVAAVQDALLSTGETLGHHDLKVVDAGADGWVPAGCSYSRGHGQRAMFNRNPAGRSSGSYPLVCIEGVQPPKSNLTAVVILLGQSNMVGRGRGDSLDPALLKSLGERDLGYYPANDACGSLCNIDGNDCGLPAFMHRNCSWSEEPTLSEQQLQPVPGQAWEQAILGSERRFGPELTLGLSLSVDAPSAYTRVVVIKRAILGAGIASFAEGQPLYNGLLRDYARVVELYGSAQTVPIGVLWMQGESDSKSASDASAYSARLRGFISRVRSDLKAPSLPFVIPQLPGRRPFPGQRPFQDQVEAAFTAAAAEVPRVRYVLGEWRNGSEAHVPTPTPQHLMDAMAGTGVTMGSRLLADMASKMSCAHYSSSSVLRIGVAVARNMAELLGWDHRDISANVSSWVEFQDREEASWATLRPADWDTCGGDAGLQSLIERLDAVSSDGPLQLNHSSHGSWSDEMG